MLHPLRPLFVLGLLAGCGYDENIPSYDLVGQLKIPKEAIQVTIFDEETQSDRVIEDPRALGPVYLGAFASVRSGDFDYAHPEMGPILDTDYPGATYPYGGTSVGRFDWGCYQALICKMVTGRYSSYDDILDFYANVLKTPIIDPYGVEVTDGTVYQERCYEINYSTSDDELAFLARDPDFSLDGDYYVSDVTIPHVNWVEGLSLWGWIDMPSRTFDFATCDSTTGELFTRYSENYYTGASHTDVLTYPSFYIDSGDWVVEDAPVITDPNQDFELELGYHYVE